MQLGTPVEFTANITLKTCEPQTGWRLVTASCILVSDDSVEISPVGMEDALVIEIEPVCACACAEEGSEGFEFTSEHCDYHGTEHSQCHEPHYHVLRKPGLWRVSVLRQTGHW